MSIVASPAHGLAALPPTGSARIDRGRLDALAARVTAVAPREPMDVEKPFTGETLGRVPRCDGGGRGARGARARARAQARWARASLRRARGDPPALPRSGARPPGRGARPDPARDRQGAPPRLRGGARRRDRLALLRQHRRAPPAPAAPPWRAAAADRDLGAPPPARRRGDHLAVELPAHARHQRRDPGAGRGQRRGDQARQPARPSARCGRWSCSRRRGCRAG